MEKGGRKSRIFSAICFIPPSTAALFWVVVEEEEGGGDCPKRIKVEGGKYDGMKEEEEFKKKSPPNVDYLVLGICSCDDDPPSFPPN